MSHKRFQSLSLQEALQVHREVKEEKIKAMAEGYRRGMIVIMQCAQEGDLSEGNILAKVKEQAKIVGS